MGYSQGLKGPALCERFLLAKKNKKKQANETKKENDKKQQQKKTKADTHRLHKM